MRRQPRQATVLQSALPSTGAMPRATMPGAEKIFTKNRKLLDLLAAPLYLGQVANSRQRKPASYPCFSPLTSAFWVHISYKGFLPEGVLNAEVFLATALVDGKGLYPD